MSLFWLDIIVGNETLTGSIFIRFLLPYMIGTISVFYFGIVYKEVYSLGITVISLFYFCIVYKDVYSFCFGIKEVFTCF